MHIALATFLIGSENAVALINILLALAGLPLMYASTLCYMLFSLTKLIMQWVAWVVTGRSSPKSDRGLKCYSSFRERTFASALVK
jgi:hypothetical protein